MLRLTLSAFFAPSHQAVSVVEQIGMKSRCGRTELMSDK